MIVSYILSSCTEMIILSLLMGMNMPSPPDSKLSRFSATLVSTLKIASAE